MVKMLKIFILFLILICCCSNAVTSPAAKATAEIVKKVFEDRSIEFDIIVYRSSLLDLVSEIVKLVETPVTILNFDDSVFINITSSTVLQISDSLGSCEQVSKRSLFSCHLYFLLTLAQEKSIFLLTFTTFQQPNCREFYPILLNQFDLQMEKWESQTFFIEKFRDFNGCPLYIYYYGFQLIYSIHEAIETSLNFSIVVLSKEDNSTDPDLIFNSGFFNMVPNAEYQPRKYYSGVAHYIVTTDKVFFVPNPVPYTYLEKALLPFDSEVWFWLIGYLAVGVFVIVVCELRKQNNSEICVWVESQSSDVELGVSLMLHRKVFMI
jgi:hypothetical protein